MESEQQAGAIAPDVKDPTADPEDGTRVDVQGQMLVPLGGAEYLLRPAYTAIRAIETKLRRTVLVLSGEAMHGELSTDDLAVIVSEMMLAEGRHNKDAGAAYKGAKAERIAELIYEEGAPRILARVAIVLLGAATGGYTAKGEVRPVKGNPAA